MRCANIAFDRRSFMSQIFRPALCGDPVAVQYTLVFGKVCLIEIQKQMNEQTSKNLETCLAEGTFFHLRRNTLH